MIDVDTFVFNSLRFVVFGSLFEEATRQGLPAVQTRHPGFYYEQAAQYAVQRKQLVNSLCKVSNECYFRSSS